LPVSAVDGKSSDASLEYEKHCTPFMHAAAIDMHELQSLPAGPPCGPYSSALNW
jgi:hypothetical protein